MAVTSKVSETKWVTDGAWISGLVGCFGVIVIALICQHFRWLDNGLTFLGVWSLTTKIDVQMFCLLSVALSMCACEIVRLIIILPKPFFNLAPEIRKGKYVALFVNSLWRYICYVAIFYFIMAFYQTAVEYGYSRNNQYYRSWFTMSDWLYTAFIWLGYPYVLLTYALKYDEERDRNSYHKLIEFILIIACRKTGLFKVKSEPVDKSLCGKILRGLIVRIFFAPILTAFFTHHFPNLVMNFGYIIEFIPQKIASGEYTHAMFNTDLINLLKPIIFGIDVVLAWCGYVLTSRWLDNETQSTEPTVLGWLVCLISYPPFTLLGLFIYKPSENYFVNLPDQYAVTFFAILMLCSFIIYTSATVVFGVRFSNLTHRGIIRSGPFAFVRHPAYASKNMAWWLGAFPMMLYLYFSDGISFKVVLAGTIGLMVSSYIYYLRAITEEKHLSIDPAYKEYCEQVKYRFIPGVL